MSEPSTETSEQRKAMNEVQNAPETEDVEKRDAMSFSISHENDRDTAEDVEKGGSDLVTLADGDSGSYVVLVHGIANIEWNTHKGWNIWQPWMESMGLGSEHTIWAFEYDIASQNPILFAKDGIEKEAKRLLDCLARQTNGTNDNHRFIFVSLDIGGTIVKNVAELTTGPNFNPVHCIDTVQALTIASMNPTNHGRLDYTTSVLVFFSCPHRYSTIEDLEDYIGTLLSLNTSCPTSSVRKIQSLAESVKETNDAFLETKFLIRAIVCNILPPRVRRGTAKKATTGTTKDEDGDSDSDGESEDKPKEAVDPEEPLPSLLDSLFSYFGTAFELVYRAKVSYQDLVQGPLVSETDILSEVAFETIKDLLNCDCSTELDIDHVCLALSQASPLYPPRLPSSRMLPTDWYSTIPNAESYSQRLSQHGISAIHLHGSFGVSAFSQLLSERLNGSGDHEKNTTSYPTLYFEFNQKDTRFNNVSAMLASFIAAIICRFGQKNATAYTFYLDEVFTHRAWSLDDLFQLFTRICGYDGPCMLKFIIGRLDQCDESRFWFLNKINSLSSRCYDPFPWIITSQRVTDFTGPLSKWPSIDIDDSLPALLRNIDGCRSSQRYPESTISSGSNEQRRIIEHALRPLSRQERAILAEPVQDEYQGHNHDYSKIDTVPPVRNPQQTLCQSSITFNEHELDAHSIIAERCIRYLRVPAVKEQMEKLYDPMIGLRQAPLSINRLNLISYASLYWSHHYRLAGVRRPFRQAMDFFDDPKTVRAWFGVYHILSNPATRLDRGFYSPLPLIAMLGLDDLVAEWIDREKDSKQFQTDCALSVIEAARNGNVSTGQLLLKSTVLEGRFLQEAVSAAVSFGRDGMLQELVLHASETDGFKPPIILLHRVSFLGMHDIAKILVTSKMEVRHDGYFSGESPLHLASAFGHLETVRVLLETKVDLEWRDTDQKTPLHRACRMENPQVVELLIDAGADIEAIDKDGLVPLQTAIEWGNIGTFELLLRAGSNPNHGKDSEDDANWQRKPLIYCAMFGRVECAKMLLKHNVDVNCFSGPLSALYVAFQGRQLEIAELLLQKGADPNANPEGQDLLLLRAVSDEEKGMDMTKLLVKYNVRVEEEDNSSTWRRTALSRAAGMPNPELVKYLLDQDANVNHCGQDSETPLYSAALAGEATNARHLIKAGADVNQKPSFGNWLPIHASYRSPEITEILLQNGADINAVAYGLTPLHLAAQENMVDTVKILLKHRPMPNLELQTESPQTDDDNGYTALSMASYHGNSRLMRSLIDAGADKNHATKLGKRPLDICIDKDSVAAVKVLLEYRVSVDHIDHNGNTVLHWITSDTPKSIIKSLVNAGADINAANKKDVTPLQRAVEAGNPGAIEYLLTKGADPDTLVDERTSLLQLACADQDLATTKALIDGGDGIRKIKSMPNNGSLLAVAVDHWPEPDQALVKYLVETIGVDINGKGGSCDHPIHNTCAFHHEIQLQYVLDKGASPDLEDSTGRRPLHLASVYPGTELLDILLPFAKTTTEQGNAPKDRMGKTPVHFAASSGNWDCFRRVIELYDEKEMNQPDSSGWTPLFWALLNRAVDSQIVKHLVDHGANLWARVKTYNNEWSPLKLGRYSGVSEEVLALLSPTQRTRQVEGKGKTERWDDEFHRSQKAHYTQRVCDSCRLVFPGINHACRTCFNFDLCFRCYSSQSECHASHSSDDWIETGAEYTDDESDKPTETKNTASNEVGEATSQADHNWDGDDDDDDDDDDDEDEEDEE